MDIPKLKLGDKVAFIHSPSKPLIILAYEKEGTEFTGNVIVGSFHRTLEYHTALCSKKVLKPYDKEDEFKSEVTL